jgi:glycosyltransferase involved in cell wall biosynthesis
LRIAVNASIYDGRPTGLGTYTREVVRALHALEPDLVVFTSRPDALPASRPIHPLGEPSRGLTGHAVRLCWVQTALPILARHGGAQVLLNTVPEGPIALAPPQVTVAHDVTPLIFPDELPRQQWYFRRYVPASLRAASIVVADSSQTRADLIERYRLDPSRVVVVLPGVDHRRFRPRAGTPLRERSRYVLYVGNLLPHKNLARLVAAFAHLRTDATLRIAGHRDPRYWPALDAQVRRLGLAERVRFLDFVPDAELPALYAGALSTVMPSMYEGFGLPVVEAMACGVPVVASTTGGLRESVGDAAVLVDPLDEEALASALQRVVDDSVLRASLRERGLAHAARFTWEATAGGLLAAVIRAAGGLRDRRTPD